MATPRIRRLVGTVAALGAAAALLPAMAQASGPEPAPRLIQPRSHLGVPAHGHGERDSGIRGGHFRAVCEEDGGHCTARVATDDSGNPIVSARPGEASGGSADLPANVAYSPQNLHTAYQLPWSSPVRQTIAVIDAYHHPNAKADLDTFDNGYNLGFFPSCSSSVTTACFQQVDQNGNPANFVNDDAAKARDWDIETNMDVQYAHAMCLNCKILLVEAFHDMPGGNDLAAANNTAARLGATEISNSWGYLEGTFSTWNPSAFNHQGIAITASAHDHGYGAYYPADLNTVVAVGGTNLTVGAGSAYDHEAVWGNGTVAPGGRGTGSGCSGFDSTYTTAPYWQKAVANWSYTGCGNRRAIADVSAVADPNTGAWIYSSVPDAQGQTWIKMGGTSLTAPIIAAAFALAGNAGGYTWPAQIMYQRSNQFHDVTTGSNGTCGAYIMCNAWTGYDGPTGLGSPWGVGGF